MYRIFAKMQGSQFINVDVYYFILCTCGIHVHVQVDAGSHIYVLLCLVLACQQTIYVLDQQSNNYP